MPYEVFNLESVLKRRGHLPIRQGDPASILYPGDRLNDVMYALGHIPFVEYFGDNPLPLYLSYFERMSFRKVVRRLLRDNRQPVPLAALEPFAGHVVEEYMTFLEQLQVLKRDGESVRIVREINNIGPSLEHYVANVCVREFRGSAEWGVILEELPRSGGDYDVLAWLDPALLYIECKSAAPDRITEDEVREFLQRTQELAPEMAILLVDTDLSVEPLIDQVFNPILRDVHGIDDPNRTFFSPHVDYPGIYFGNRLIYVTHAKRSIVRQLRRCIQHYYAHTKSQAFFSEDPDNPIEYVRRPPRAE